MCLAASFAIHLPLLLRPLKGLLGAYLPHPIPGVLVTTERPLSIQRFTAAHEVGHFRLEHLPSLDDESILRRMAMPNAVGHGRSEYAGSRGRCLRRRIPHATLADRMALPSPRLASARSRHAPQCVSALAAPRHQL